ncbi:MAG: DedA family protein [Chloroflexota bacterium]|nr:DedA family protein [Chloroflexota bacterium]
MSNIAEQIIAWATGLIDTLGYIGLVFLIALETLIPPIPSELILPLAGYRSATGQFNFYLMVIAATTGSLLGSSIIYGVGRWAGDTRIEGWIDRYGKWMVITREDLAKSRRWFERYGTPAVIIARVIPGMRSIISLPAGLTGMPYGKFALLTVLGSAFWNFLLIGAGYLLGDNWSQVEVWLDPISPVIYALIVLAVVGFIVKRLLDRRRASGVHPAQNQPDL